MCPHTTTCVLILVYRCAARTARGSEVERGVVVELHPVCIEACGRFVGASDFADRDVEPPAHTHTHTHIHTLTHSHRQSPIVSGIPGHSRMRGPTCATSTLLLCAATMLLLSCCSFLPTMQVLKQNFRNFAIHWLPSSRDVEAPVGAATKGVDVCAASKRLGE